jgi:HTH-type transcriptional regulator, competence development regulator
MTQVQSNHYTTSRSTLFGLADCREASTRRAFDFSGERDGSLLESEIAADREPDSATDDRGSGAVKKASAAHTFGARLRQKRTDKKISLRKFAEMIGVSSTYLSQVEQGHYSPPTADRVTQIAAILGEDADEWIGLADRVPDDVDDIVKEHPKDMPELMRAARGMTPAQFAKLQEMIRKLRAKEK